MHVPSLPHLFLADLPPEAPLTPSLVRDACISVKRNRAQWLLPRRTSELVDIIAYNADRWLQADYPLRRIALQSGAAELGFSSPTMARGLDAFFRQLTHDHLIGWLAQDLGDSRRLDEFAAPASELRHGRLALARGPELLAQVAAGNLPVSTLSLMVAGLLLRSGQFIKCSQRSTLLPRLFAHSLAELEPKLGACLELASWPGGHEAFEGAMMGEADCLVVQGSDTVVEDLRRRMPSTCRCVAYGHRLSFGFIAGDVLGTFLARKVADRAAVDIAAWNQLGCLSPHVLYVEDTGTLTPEGFAAALSEALVRMEQTEPRGALRPEESAAIDQRRSLHQLRAAHHRSLHRDAITVPRGAFFEAPTAETQVWSSEGSTAWTVVYEADPTFRTSCLNRFIYVKPCRNLGDALRRAEIVRGQISTVGIAATEGRAQELALELARWGVSRVCPLGRMQDPPLAWRHDGRPALSELVQWTDWEQASS